MTLPANVILCSVCLGLGTHRYGCPEADDEPVNECCGLCGCELDDDAIQLCADCDREHPGD